MKVTTIYAMEGGKLSAIRLYPEDKEEKDFLKRVFYGETNTVDAGARAKSRWTYIEIRRG